MKRMDCVTNTEGITKHHSKSANRGAVRSEEWLEGVNYNPEVCLAVGPGVTLR
jgi:hypothetical protein